MVAAGAVAEVAKACDCDAEGFQTGEGVDCDWGRWVEALADMVEEEAACAEAGMQSAGVGQRERVVPAIEQASQPPLPPDSIPSAPMEVRVLERELGLRMEREVELY